MKVLKQLAVAKVMTSKWRAEVGVKVGRLGLGD